MNNFTRVLSTIALASLLGPMLKPGDAAALRPLNQIVAAFAVSASDSTIEEAVQLRWTGAAGYDVFFRITRNGLPLTVKAANDSSFQDVTAIPGVIYDYCVSLHDVASGLQQASACNQGSRTIFRPTQVAASDGYYEEWVQVEWLDNSRVETGYRIYRRPAGGGPFALLGDVAAGETFYQ
ncbi:MAG: hypothetical protein FD129_2832, partial [bacterium]